MPNGEDNNWIRLCGALDGFFVERGHWPSRVRLYRAAYEDLRDFLFTPASFQRIREKVDLLVEEKMFRSEGDSGAEFDFLARGFVDVSSVPVRAGRWLAISPDRHSTEADMNLPVAMADERFDLCLGSRKLHWLTPSECVYECIRHVVYDRRQPPGDAERAAGRLLWSDQDIYAGEVHSQDSRFDDVGAVNWEGCRYVLRHDALAAGFPSVLYNLELSLPTGDVSWKHSRLTDLTGESPSDVSRSGTDSGVSAEPSIVSPSRPLGPLLSRSIRNCGLSVRTTNCLLVDGRETVADLVAAGPDELLGIKNFGKKCLREVATLLASFELGFAMRFDGIGEFTVIRDAGISPRSLFSELEGFAGGITRHVDPAPKAAIELLLGDVRHAANALMLADDKTLPGWIVLREALSEDTLTLLTTSGLSSFELQRHLSSLVGLFAGLQNGKSVSLGEELVSAFGSLKERDRVAATRYFGLDGQPGQTLEEVGGSLGVTRERVRQLVKRFTETVTSMRPLLPVANVLNAIVENVEVPMSLEDWRAAAPLGVRPASAAELLAIKFLQEWGWLPTCCWTLTNGGWFVSAPGRQEELEEATGVVSADIARSYAWGAVHVGEIALRTGQPVTISNAILKGDDRWCESRSGWFVRRGKNGGVLGKRTRRMLATLGELSLADIKAGLRRAAKRPVPGRRSLTIPPRRVLETLFFEMGLQPGAVAGSFRHERGTPKLALGSTSMALLAAFTKGSGAVTHSELDEAARAHGLTAMSARMAMSYSPLLRRIEYGVYALLGRQPSVADVAAARGRIASEGAPMIVATNLLPSGSIQVVFDASTVNTSCVPIPPRLIPVGAWTIRDGDTEFAAFVRTHYVTRIGRVAANFRKRGKAQLAARFDVASRTIHCESFESGESA